MMNVGSVETSGAVPGLSAPAGAQKQTPPHPAQSAGEDPVNLEQIKRQVAEMESQISSMNVSLAYTTYGEHDEKIAIAVVNKETGELIREIPSQEIQTLYAKMSELTGMIFNKEI